MVAKGQQYQTNGSERVEKCNKIEKQKQYYRVRLISVMRKVNFIYISIFYLYTIIVAQFVCYINNYCSS